MTRVLDPDHIARALKRIAHEILERNRGTGRLMLMGIHTRGVPLAVRIAEAMGEIEAGDAVKVQRVVVEYPDLVNSPDWTRRRCTARFCGIIRT